MSFLDNINFLEALTAVLIVFHFSAHYQRSALWPDPKPLNFYQCHWSPTKRKAFLYSACLELSLSRSRLFWPLMASTGTFHFLQATTPHNILTYKFTITQRHVDFITKWDKCYHKVGELCFLTKWDK